MKIKRLRLERGITKVQLAQELGVNKRTILRWEQDMMSMSLKNAVKVAEFFEISLDELVKEDKMQIHTIDNRNFLLMQIFELMDTDDIYSTSENVEDYYDLLIGKIGLQSYLKLKSALIPITDATKKRDKLLIFDIEKINSHWYGKEVFLKFKEFLYNFKNGKSERYSVLAGDLISKQPDSNEKINKIIIEQLGNEMFDLNQKNYYLYYVHNVNKEQSERLESIFKCTDFYMGMIDMTFHSILKDYIANHSPLVNILVRSQNKIYIPEGSQYTRFFDTEGSISLQEIENPIFELLLSFKIETNYENDGDRRLAVESINKINFPQNMEDVKLFVDPAKVDKYLLCDKGKSAIMRSLGLGEINSNDLSELIINKLESCYFYNLEFKEGKDFSVTKFSVVLELPFDSPKDHLDKLRKVEVALKYEDEKLQLITMY